MNLAENATWDAGIYQIETEDPVQGGEGGVSNLQAKQLANRTQFLKQQLNLKAAADHNHDAAYSALDHDHAGLYATLADLSDLVPEGSLQQNGYVQLPGGLIIQWGYSADTDGGGTITFPVEFPNAAFYTNFEILAAGGPINYTKYISALSKSAATYAWFGNGWGDITITGYYWIAVGH